MVNAGGTLAKTCGRKGVGRDEDGLLRFCRDRHQPGRIRLFAGRPRRRPAGRAVERAAVAGDQRHHRADPAKPALPDRRSVADLDKTFSPVSRTTNSACEQVEHESTPQRLKWRLQCTGQLDMDVAGEFVFETPHRYTATLTTEASMAGKLMQKSRVTIEAQWIGECR